MKQPEHVLERGTRVRTHDVLESGEGMIVAPHLLVLRRGGAKGRIDGVVGGHGGDVYWVRHDGDVAPYSFTEFELSERPPEVRIEGAARVIRVGGGTAELELRTPVAMGWRVRKIVVSGLYVDEERALAAQLYREGAIVAIACPALE